QAVAVAGLDELELAAEQLRRLGVLRVPVGLEDDVLRGDQALAAVRERLVDHELGRGGGHLAVGDERAVDVVDAHPALARLVDARDAGGVGEQRVAGVAVVEAGRRGAGRREVRRRGLRRRRESGDGEQAGGDGAADHAVAATGSGRTTTVSSTGTISSAAMPEAMACSRIASGLSPW